MDIEPTRRRVMQVHKHRTSGQYARSVAWFAWLSVAWTPETGIFFPRWCAILLWARTALARRPQRVVRELCWAESQTLLEPGHPVLGALLPCTAIETNRRGFTCHKHLLPVTINGILPKLVPPERHGRLPCNSMVRTETRLER